MADAWLGSEIGLLKGVDLKTHSFINHGDIESAEKSKEICVMCWANREETEICVGLRNRIVKTFCTKSCSFISEKEILEGQGNFVGLFKEDSFIGTCVESGNLQMWKGDKKLVDIGVGNNVSRMRHNPHQMHQVGTGGKENDLKIWDLNSPDEPVFKAKNVRNDMLDLHVPVWVSDLGFVSQSNSQPVVAVGTRYHQIRLYDTKAQKRPVLNVEFQDLPIITVAVPPNNNNILLVGNSIGTMAALDLRTGKPLGFYKGAVGSIRSISCSGEYVASCGLDRFLRVHNLESRKLIKKVYLKSRLNVVLLPSDSSRQQWYEEKESEDSRDIVEKRNLEEAENEISDEEADEIWNQMDVVTTEKPVKKKRKKKLK